MAKYSAFIILLASSSMIHVGSAIIAHNCTTQEECLVDEEVMNQTTLLQTGIATIRTGASSDRVDIEKKADQIMGQTQTTIQTHHRALLSKRTSTMSNDFNTNNCFENDSNEYECYSLHAENKFCSDNMVITGEYTVGKGSKGWMNCASKCHGQGSNFITCHPKAMSYFFTGTYNCLCYDTCTMWGTDNTLTNVYQMSDTFTKTEWEAWYRVAPVSGYMSVISHAAGFSCNEDYCVDVILTGENTNTVTLSNQGRRRRFQRQYMTDCDPSLSVPAAEGSTGRRRRYSETSYTDEEGCALTLITGR